MSTSEQAIPAIALPSWVKAATRCGFNVKPIFQRHGITLDLIHLQDSTVSLEALDRVLETCIEVVDDAHFPFVVGETFAFEYLPDLETFLTTSSSLRDAARVLDWIPALVNPMIDARLEEHGDSVHLVLRQQPDAPPLTKPYHAEIFFASILKFVRLLLGDRPRLRALRFRHPPPTYAERYHAFFELPVAFDQTRDELVFDRALLDAPLEGDFPALHQQAAALVEQRVARASHNTVIGRMHRAFSQQPALLAGNLETMAAALGMGGRTLQRRLASEGVTFADVYDEARFARARSLLQQGEDLESISESLGFADRRSFTRAFKRWSGVTPSAFRGQGAASAPR